MVWQPIHGGRHTCTMRWLPGVTVWAGFPNWAGNIVILEDEDEEMNQGNEQEANDKERVLAEGEDQEEGWEGIVEDNAGTMCNN